MKAEKKVGIFFVIAVLILVLLLESVDDKSFFRKEYLLKAYFRSVNGLELGEPVRLAGMKVGKVKDIKITGDKVEVLMSIEQGVAVKTDSRAAVKMTGLLGGRYLGLSLGSLDSASLEPGSAVKSIDSPNLDELVSSVSAIVSDVKKFANILSDNRENIQTTLNNLSESSPQLKETLTNLSKIANKIENGEGTLGKLISDDTLYQEARKTVAEIGKAAEGVQNQTPLIAFTSVLFGLSR